MLLTPGFSATYIQRSILCGPKVTNIDRFHCISNYVLCVCYHSAFTGGIYRYYDSRRRIYNDSQPRRAAKVAEAQRNRQKKNLQKQVHNFILIIPWISINLCSFEINVLKWLNHYDPSIRRWRKMWPWILWWMKAWTIWWWGNTN